MKIYVGNLSYDVTEDELRQEFATYGEVTSVSIPTDKYSGRPRGFAFVEMASKSEGETAISSLDKKVLRERTILVSEARPRSDDRGRVSYNDNRGRKPFGGGFSGRGGRQKRY